MFLRLKSNPTLRKFLYFLLKDKIVARSLTIDDLKIWFSAGLNLNLYFQKKVIIEPSITKNLLNLIKDDDIFYDIGANIGYYTVILGNYLKNGKVISVEPDKSNLRFLKLNIKKNNLKNIIVIPKAVSDKKGYNTLYVDKVTGRTSSLEKSAWHTSFNIIDESKVETETMDSLTYKYGVPTIIKCDIEGHELSFLEGAKETLKYQPIIILEVVEKNKSEVMKILNEYGYKIFDANQTLDASNQIKDFNARDILAISNKDLHRLVN